MPTIFLNKTVLRKRGGIQSEGCMRPEDFTISNRMRRDIRIDEAASKEAVFLCEKGGEYLDSKAKEILRRIPD